MRGIALVRVVVVVCLAVSAWGQNSIDDQIKQEQSWASNENLPASVKAIAQQRLAKLQQAKSLQAQIDAAQQYLAAHPDLSADDKSAINGTITQLSSQMQGLLSSSAPAAPVTTATAGQQPSQPSNKGGESGNHPADGSKVATADAAGPAAPASAAPAAADPATVLQSAALIAASNTTTVKTVAKAGATTIANEVAEGRNVESTFNSTTTKLAVFTLLGAMNPQGLSQVSGDTLDLLQRKINTQTETARTDKELSAPANNTGSTAPIEKPGLPVLLGIALANGSLQQETSGTGLTLSTSPYAIAAALNGGDTDQNYQKYSIYERLGVAATFDVQGETNPDLTQVSRRQLENWNVKVRLTPDRSTRSDAFAEELKHTDIPAGFKAEGMDFTAAQARLRGSDPLSKSYTAFIGNIDWLTKLIAANPKATADKLEPLIEAQLLSHLQTDFIPQAAGQPFMTPATAADDLQAIAKGQAAHKKAAADFETLATAYSQRFEASVEYINQYQQSVSPYSTFNFLINKHPSSGLVLTGNAQVDLYQNPSHALNQSTFRDVAAAFSLEQRLFRSPFVINALNEAGVTVSAVGRYEYFAEYAGVAGKKPNIGTFTLKTDIPIAAGVSIPLGVSYATSPEDQILKTSNYVQGNFGLSFDLDKLYTVLHAPQQ